ncbi:MAG: hypothetical protein ABJG47_18945 [Ekhidna sp.]
MAFSSMRIGKRYRLINYGEKSEFILLEIVGRNEYKLKDLFSMESYLMSDLTQYGRGDDFELREIHD